MATHRIPITSGISSLIAIDWQLLVNSTITVPWPIHVTINIRFLAGKQWCSRWMLPILSQPILAPKYNVHQRSKEHDMVSVSLSAFVLLYSNFQVQRLAWKLWIRINLLIRHILTWVLRKCHFWGVEDITTTFLPSTGIGCNANTY